MFGDPYALWEPDSRHAGRGNLIGASAELRLLFVVHVQLEADDETIRIISARKAAAPERRRYEQEE